MHDEKSARWSVKEGCERDEKGRSRTSSSKTRRSNALLMMTSSSDVAPNSSHRPPPLPSYSNAYSSDESSVAQPSCEGVGSPSSLPKGWFPLRVSQVNVFPLVSLVDKEASGQRKG